MARPSAAGVRDDAALRAQSPHVFWHLRQLLRLAAHLEQCRRDGRDVMHDAIDAAALEAFALSARALVEFFWGERRLRKDGTAVYPDDARAVDWLVDDPIPWRPGPMPRELERLTERVGWGVAHVSFRRIDPAAEWGWAHLDIAHRLASCFYDFASRVRPSRVSPDFERGVYAEVMDYRTKTADPHPFAFPKRPQTVATPGFAVTVAQLRTPPDDKGLR